MIIVTAQLWPHGNQSQAREILNASISNQGMAPEGASYFGHVITPPYEKDGVPGVEADVEVRQHQVASGIIPLIITTLAAAHFEDENVVIPPSRALTRKVLARMDEFEKALKGR